MDREPVDFERWYERHHPRLVASVGAVFADDELAADAADEAIVRAYERWDRVSVMASPEGWAYRVAINVARRRLRRRGLEHRLLLRSRPEPSPAPAGELWQVVAGLGERQRLAIALRHVGHLPEAEIAAVMGITRGGVSSTLRAAYRNLRLATEADRDHGLQPAEEVT